MATSTDDKAADGKIGSAVWPIKSEIMHYEVIYQTAVFNYEFVLFSMKLLVVFVLFSMMLFSMNCLAKDT